MRVHSFSWNGDIPLQLLLPLLARQVHHRAPEAELHQPNPRGQDGDAGGKMPLHGSGRARRLSLKHIAAPTPQEQIAYPWF